MSQSPVEEVQSPAPNDYIELFKLEHAGIETFLDAGTDPDTGEPVYQDPILYFCNSGDVTVGGRLYEGFPVELTGLEFEGGGAPARPTLRIGAIPLEFQGMIRALDYLLGAKLTISRIFSEHVHDESLIFGSATFVLDRLSEMSKTTVSWELRSILDFDGHKLPKSFVNRDYCPFTVRKWIGPTDEDWATYTPTDEDWEMTQAVCPYSGPTIFDEDGNETNDPTKEHFARTLEKCCQLRYTNLRDMPFGGFPGAER